MPYSPHQRSSDEEFRPEPAPLYETVLTPTVDGQRITVTIATVPSRAVDATKRIDPDDLPGLLALIGQDDWPPSIPLNSLPAMSTALALMLDPRLERGESSRELMWSRFAYTVDRPDGTIASSFHAPPQWDDEPDGARRVSERLLVGSLIPFELSPLSGHTLSSIVTGTGGSALVVAVLDHMASPWLLVAAPTGVIVLKVSHAAGDALGTVVRHRIIQWLAPDLLEGNSDESDQ
jgi:hypothetical protein